MIAGRINDSPRDTVLIASVSCWAWSGLRALRTRNGGPVAQDALVSVCALVASVLLVLYLQTVRVPWAPAVAYSTLGTLVLVSLYDLARFAFPTRWFETLWLYEHLVKMIGAHSLVITAFSGTVLWAWQPYSQLVPSTLWVAAMIGYVVRIRGEEPRIRVSCPTLRPRPGDR